MSSTTFSGPVTSTNGFIGSVTGLAPTTTLAATATVTAEQSGSTFFLSSATEFVTTLPAPAVGLNYRFIVTAAPAAASYTVVTAASANIMKGFAVNAAGALVTPIGDGDTVTFVDGQAVAGDSVSVVSDGTSWFVTGFAQVAAGVTVTKAA
jgi:hypothetical protein